MSDDTFAAKLRNAGLRGNWERQSEDAYHLDEPAWQSFTIMHYSDGWTAYHYDHDAGIGEDGNLYTSSDIVGDDYPTWIDAAKVIEGMYLR